MSEPVRPRTEPEIIPPGAPLPRDRGIWINADTDRTHYVYTARIGPVGLGLMTLAGGAVAALAGLLLLGTAVIGLAAVGVLTIGGIIAGVLRGPPR